MAKLPLLYSFNGRNATNFTPAVRLRLDTNVLNGRRPVDVVVGATPAEIVALGELLATIAADPALIQPLLRRAHFLQGPDNAYHY